MSVKRRLVRFAGPNVIDVYRNITEAFGHRNRRMPAMNYDDYWTRRPDFRMQPRFSIIAEHVRTGSTVLDVGCGDGTMLAYLRDTKHVVGVGIDISAKAVERARIAGVEARVQELTVLDSESSPGSFDHVIMSEVIEHVSDPEQYLVRGHRLAKKSLIVTFPNIAYWPHRLRLLFGRFPVQWVYHPSEHLRFWSTSDFSDWVLDTLELPRPPLMCASNGTRVLGLHRRWPNFMGNQIVVIVPKNEGEQAHL